MSKVNENIGVVGQGFVGTAVREKFKDHFNVYTFDINKREQSKIFTKNQISEEYCTLSDLVESCEILFLCVPTPMFPSGKCDTGIVENAIIDIDKLAKKSNKKPIVILKSTVPPGTVESFNKDYKNVGIVFSPEFLTEANSIEDFKKQTRIILGIDWIEYIEPIMNVFSICFPKANIITLSSSEAEMSKYMINTFLATKVSFFNDMFRVIEGINTSGTIDRKMSFESIVSAMLLDPRIGKSHYMVPGPDGDYGYGGHCFPGNHTVETPYGKITLEDAYKKFNSGTLLECLSFDHNICYLETKMINKVTKNHYEGDLLIFELENGKSFKCTAEHLFPINRNGNLILVQAKDILESDDFYSASEYINKKALTYDKTLLG